MDIFDKIGTNGLNHIVKYKNRRLYNITTNKIINYQEIIDLIKNDVEVNIICNVTGINITKDVLYDILIKTDKFKQKMDLQNIYSHIKNVEKI
jgi:polyhydroxyalkanoate synthesis regulator protein